MLNQDFARIRAHRNNIARYRRLLRTKLSELERQYLDRRLREERSVLATLTSQTFSQGLTLPETRRPTLGGK